MKIPGSLKKIWFVWFRVSMVILATIVIVTAIMLTDVSDYWIYLPLAIMLISTFQGLPKILKLVEEFIDEEFGEDK